MNNYKFVENNIEDIIQIIWGGFENELNKSYRIIETSNLNDIRISFFVINGNDLWFSYLLDNQHINVLKSKIRKLKIKRILI